MEKEIRGKKKAAKAKKKNDRIKNQQFMGEIFWLQKSYINPKIKEKRIFNFKYGNMQARGRAVVLNKRNDLQKDIFG